MDKVVVVDMVVVVIGQDMVSVVVDGGDAG